MLSVGANVAGLILAIPAAWSMAFAPTKRTKDVLMWMLSTKMMPAAGVFMAIYFLFLQAHLLDNRWGVGFLLMMANLPILVWMLYTYFKEIPVDILEAARMDGASLANEIIYVLTPMAIPGIASTMLLSIILSWNEAFWTLNLTNVNAAPLTNMIASFSSPEGDFLGAAVGRVGIGDRADPHSGLVLAEATGARLDFRRGEIGHSGGRGKNGPWAASNSNKSARNSAASRSSTASA